MNVTPEQNLAMGMALRRGGIVGSEAGVFARQFYARMMAPTRKGREITAQYGINLDEHASHGTISGQGLSDKLARSFGKGLSKQAIAVFDKAIEEHGEDLLSDRGKFAESVVKARRSDGNKLSETDRKHLVRSANEYFDWTKSGIRGGELLDLFMATNNPMVMQGFLGDKQGARGTALLAERDKYYEAKADQAKANGFAQHVSDDMNKGLAAATDRLAASFDALQNTVVQANEGWLTSAADAASGLITSFNNLDPKIQQAAGIFAGLTSVTAAGGLVFSFVSLVSSARRAAAALDVLAAGGIAAGGPAGKAAGKSGKAASALGALGFVSRTAGWAATAYAGYEYLWPEIKAEAAGTDSAGGGGAANYRRRLAALNSQKVWGDLPSSGRFDRFQPVMLDDVSSRYLRNGGGDGVASKGWQDSVILGTGVPASRGFGDPGKTQVEGVVNGAAELHVNINGEMRPTTYLEGIIHRAENVANVSLHGHLGTSMQGPGDNSTKASQSAAVAAP